MPTQHRTLPRPNSTGPLPFRLNASAARVTIDTLNHDATPDTLLSADFDFDAATRPAPHLALHNERLVLHDSSPPPPDSPTATWDIQLHPAHPLALDATVENGQLTLNAPASGLGEVLARTSGGPLQAEFAAGAADLQSLGLWAQSGGLYVMLHGDFPALEAVLLDSSSGFVTVALAGNFPQLRDFSLRSNNGRVALSLAGTYAPGLALQLNTSSGNTTLDLLSKFGPPTHLALQSMAGNIYVRTPLGLGVGLALQQQTGTLYAHSFAVSSDGRWLNRAAQTSDPTLHIDAATTGGNLIIEER